MKKRIISLILVVAMAFLTLTGCSYNYAKDDMSKYATLDAEAFYNALQALTITDGDFGTDETVRQNKVKDAIAAAILKVTDTTNKKYEGKIENYDALYFCYYATDAEGNIFFATKMDESKPSNIQIGLTTLEGLNKAVSEGALDKNIEDYLYYTSSATVVGKGDAISISYTKTWKDSAGEKTETVNHEYFVIGENNKLADALVGARVGVVLPEIKFTETDTATSTEIEYTYSDVKVESIIKDNSTDKVADGDVIFVTYTYSFSAAQWLNSETNKYELPEGFDAANIDSDGNYKATVSYQVMNVTKDADDATDETKTFAGQLVGKNVGSTTSSITVKNDKIDGKTVEMKYTNVKVNWVVKSEQTAENSALNGGFTVTYTPYDEELKEDNSNKKTETNIYGVKIPLNGVELTYHIFPVYYLDVAELTAEVIIRDFYSTVAATQTKEHDHTEEDHEHETEYVFDTLNDEEYKNGDKTLATLITELVTLNSTLTTKKKAETEALKAVTTAQSNLAKDDGASESETASLKTKLQNANTAYLTAKKAADEAKADVDAKITAILECKKGTTGVADALIADYNEYQYDTLEAAYKADINKKVAAQVIDYLKKNIKFEDNLPKRAVKNAYKAIMNTYKNDFYEGKYSSGTSTSTSTSTETNYAHYNGDFDAYLIDKVTSNKGTMEDVKKSIQTKAEETVKDIIIIYVFANAVENKWNTDVTLTKAEKKEIKKNLENTALLYKQYGLSFTYNVDDSYHAEQFDKAMNYLLEVEESSDDTVLDVVYKHVKYTAKAQDK